MVYDDFKDLNRGKASDKFLRDKSFNIAKNPNCDGYQCELKKSFGETVKMEIIFSKKLAEKLHKPIIRKYMKYGAKI